MRARHLLGTVAALVVVMAGIALPSGAASAANGYCTGAGVNVVVDFGDLGGVSKACGQGSTAAAVFRSAGFSLRGTPRMSADFVCTVNGKPADGQCTATDAYWGLFLGTAAGGWKYASLGASSQSVEEGGTVAFAWQHTKGKSLPRATPARVRPSATPTPAVKKGHARSGKKDAAPSAAPSPTAAASAAPSPTPTAKPRKRRHHAAVATSPSPSASADAGEAHTGTLSVDNDNDDDSDGGGVPWWIPAGIVVLLGAGGGAVAWRRSRAGTVS